MRTTIRQAAGVVLFSGDVPLYAEPTTMVANFCKPIGNTPKMEVLSISYDFAANTLNVVVESAYETNRRLGVVQ